MSLHRFLGTVCGAAALMLSVAVSTPSAGAATKPVVPTIHEKFTVLPCPSKPTTTTQIEGCAEHKVLATDHTIDQLNAKIFTKLSRSGRRELDVANAEWVQYRDSVCTTEASIYSGGSVQPVAYANCLVSIDGSHVGELKRILLTVSLGG